MTYNRKAGSHCFLIDYLHNNWHNYVKRRYAERTKTGLNPNHDPQELLKQHNELIILCSSVKPIAAWLCDKAVVVCRERVGGVGFLEANGFGGMFAHAGITAEGDARVLCAKVTKELMDILEKGEGTKNLEPIVCSKTRPAGLDLAKADVAAATAAQLVDLCVLVESLMAFRVRRAVDTFKEKLVSFMAQGDAEFRYESKVFLQN